MLCLVLYYTRIHSILMVVAGESQSRPLDPYCYTIVLLLLLLLLASSWHSSHPIFSLEPSSRRGSYFNKTISSSCIIVNSCSQHVCIYCNYLFRWDFVLMISLDVWNHQKLEKQVIDPIVYCPYFRKLTFRVIKSERSNFSCMPIRRYIWV